MIQSSHNFLSHITHFSVHLLAPSETFHVYASNCFHLLYIGPRIPPRGADLLRQSEEEILQMTFQDSHTDPHMHVGLCYISCVKYLNFTHLFSIKHVLDQIYCISSVVGSRLLGSVPS